MLMNIILLSGGSGTRLWPISNGTRSKQFIKIFKTDSGDYESMVQRMYRMIKKVSPNANIVIATSESQVASIHNQLGNDVNISLEPCRKDTFPAIALATAYLHDVMGIDENEKVVVCPVDPLVDETYFYSLTKVFELAGNCNLALMGIKPTYPSEKYGYILEKNGTVFFKEKPDKETAEKYISEGALWNGGVFGYRISYLLGLIESLCGASNYEDLLKSYPTLKKISFDYAIAENERNIKIEKYAGRWKDLGTWNTFSEAMSEQFTGNVVLGENCENTHVINELSIPIIVLGLKDSVVAASPDGILVSKKEASSHLKEYAPDSRPMFEQRVWGQYKVLDYQGKEDGEKSLTKELIILPGKNISYQRHSKRKEFWTFVKGNGYLVIDGVIKKVGSGDFVCIDKGQLHSIRAIDELHIIEVQIGSELAEEDIERFDWNWNDEK